MRNEVWKVGRPRRQHNLHPSPLRDFYAAGFSNSCVAGFVVPALFLSAGIGRTSTSPSFSSDAFTSAAGATTTIVISSGLTYLFITARTWPAFTSARRAGYLS